MSLDHPITPVSLVDQLVTKIADAIVVGEIKPGERIREAVLAQKLGVSRGILREAMQRLEGRKVVSRTSNIGVHVIGLNQADLLELYAMREALEGMAARLAATHMSDAEIANLRALLAEHEQNEDLKQGEGYFQRADDQDFHIRIAKGSRNARLQHALCEELYYQFRLYRYRSSTRAGRAQQALAEHQAIVAAIAARDPDGAEAAMRLHLTHSRESVTWRAEPQTAAA